MTSAVTLARRVEFEPHHLPPNNLVYSPAARKRIKQGNPPAAGGAIIEMTSDRMSRVGVSNLYSNCGVSPLEDEVDIGAPMENRVGDHFTREKGEDVESLGRFGFLQSAPHEPARPRCTSRIGLKMKSGPNASALLLPFAACLTICLMGTLSERGKTRLLACEFFQGWAAHDLPQIR